MLLVVVVVFPNWRFFISLLFDVILHLSVSYRRVFIPILYFQSSSSQSDSRHFHFNFSRLFFFTASATVLSGLYLPHAFFTLHSFADGGRNTPSRIFLSAWCLNIRPSIYQLRQWATKHRVRIQLLNLFRLFKVIWEDYENTLNKTWCTAKNCFNFT